MTKPAELEPEVTESVKALQATIDDLQSEIDIYKDQIDSLEKFSTVVVGQRNDAQTEVAKLTMLLNKAKGN